MNIWHQPITYALIFCFVVCFCYFGFFALVGFFALDKNVSQLIKDIDEEDPLDKTKTIRNRFIRLLERIIAGIKKIFIFVIKSLIVFGTIAGLFIMVSCVFGF